MNPVSGPNLPASTVSSDGARLDVAADGFGVLGMRGLSLTCVYLTPWHPRIPLTYLRKVYCRILEKNRF